MSNTIPALARPLYVPSYTYISLTALSPLHSDLERDLDSVI